MTNLDRPQRINQNIPDLYTLNPEFQRNQTPTGSSQSISCKSLQNNQINSKKKVFRYNKENEKFDYFAQLDSLQREIERLKDHIENKKSSYSKEINDLKLSYEIKIQTFGEAHKKQFSSINTQIDEKNMNLDKIRTEISNEKAQLEKQLKELRHVCLHMESENKEIKKELEILKERNRVLTQEEIPSLRVSIFHMKDHYNIELQNLNKQKEKEHEDCKREIDGTQAEILKLITDLNETKNSHKQKEKIRSQEILKLKEKLMAMSKEALDKEKEIKDTLISLEAYKEEGGRFSKEARKLERNLNTEMKMKEKLSRKISKLTKLVYGNTDKSPRRQPNSGKS
ncbi:unnamed protein product [Blepharisma stoltei]|uniref:Uncharacterized protein n=1 Tax=Blepharisma stoltei TaxID=1481888 RepID=A0AAU9K7K5_9CILI|nr:unnamed protein product [Blepharisma stoltei]